MKYDDAILVKLDKKTRNEMRRSKINWSATIRELIKNELGREARLEEAEKLRKSLFKKYSGPDSTEIIRRYRDARHGASSN